MTSAAVAAGLTLLLMALARLMVVGPLSKLARAAKRVEDGKDIAADLDIRSRDEVGQLASAFRSMAAAIEVREEHINRRNEDMRLVLDNVGQGFVNVGRSWGDRLRAVAHRRGLVRPHRGHAAVLGLPAAVRSRRSATTSRSPGWRSSSRSCHPTCAWMKLPRLVNKDGRTYELAYRPIYSDVNIDGSPGTLDKTIVIITDVTVRLERERSEMRQREMMSMYRRLIADRPAFDEFFDEATALLRDHHRGRHRSCHPEAAGSHVEGQLRAVRHRQRGGPVPRD